MEPSFIVDPAHIHHTLNQCDGIFVSYDLCGSKLHMPRDRNKISDIVHKHNIRCQSDVIVAV